MCGAKPSKNLFMCVLHQNYNILYSIHMCTAYQQDRTSDSNTVLERIHRGTHVLSNLGRAPWGGK